VLKVFLDVQWNIAWLKALIGVNNTSRSVDPRPHHDRLRTGCTTAKIDKIKELALIF